VQLSRGMHFEGGAFARHAVDQNVPTRLLDESVNLAQAKAAPFTHLLGCEERFEDAVDDPCRHALAGVRHNNSYMIADRDTPFCLETGPTEFL
jgi:hypothetical protein